MTRRFPYELWAPLADDEGDAFLQALYPGLDYATQTDLLNTDRRSSQHPSVVLAMAEVLRRRGTALVSRRPAARGYPQRDIAQPPPPPRLQELRGGPLDPFRMAANTAVLGLHQTQVRVWADTIEERCRAEAMVLALAVAEREAAARIAKAEAATAEATLRLEQARIGTNLLIETIPERRDLVRAATALHSLPQGK